MNDPQTYSGNIPVIELDDRSRSRFISRTYNHLFCAITVFTLIEIALFKSGMAATIAHALLGTSWLLVLGGFMLISWLARSAAHRSTSQLTQYAALAAYVVPARELRIGLSLLGLVRMQARECWCDH